MARIKEGYGQSLDENNTVKLIIEKLSELSELYMAMAQFQSDARWHKLAALARENAEKTKKLAMKRQLDQLIGPR